ncbi:MAG: hypothetical protein LBL55_01680, partial [Propionibacteriaceae bacterium]|nr:hypothetical protein [Propionibacteriaceae bacterium]
LLSALVEVRDVVSNQCEIVRITHSQTQRDDETVCVGCGTKYPCLTWRMGRGLSCDIDAIFKATLKTLKKRVKS